MNKFILIIATIIFVGCATQPIEYEKKELISKEEVISLLKQKKVKGIFQPRYGYVSIDLKDGSTKWFKQEKMDWIIRYVIDNHRGELEYAAME